MSIFTGSAVAIVTPFADGQIDYDSYDRLLEWHLAEGTDAIVVCGTTGEAPTLQDPEHLELVEHTVAKINRRLPVIAGVGSNDTAHAAHFSVEAEARGVDGLLHVTPYYNKPSKTGLIEHFKAVAAVTSLPIILYTVPGRSSVNLPADVVAELAKVPNIVGVKEASGNVAQATKIAALTDADFDIYSGNDDIIVPILSLGGKGVISVLANVAPKDTHDMVAKYLAGNTAVALDLQLKASALIDALFAETNPIPVKAALWLMGKINYEYRLPLCKLEDAHLEQLRQEMQTYGLI